VIRKITFLALLLLFACSAHATITPVQGAHNSATGNSITLTMAGNCTAGNALFVFAAIRIGSTAGPVINTPTDPAGDTFVKLNNYIVLQPGFDNLAVWEVVSCIGTTGTITVTGTTSGTTGMIGAVEEYSHSGSLVVDQHHLWPCGHLTNATSISNTTMSTPTVTSPGNVETAFVFVYDNAASHTWSLSGGFTVRQQDQNAFPFSLAIGDGTIAANTTTSATFTGAANTDLWYSGIITLSEGGAVLIPPIEQEACGDSAAPWHELGTFSGQDVKLEAQKAGDCILFEYRARPGLGGTSVINTNGYTWHNLISNDNYLVAYAQVPSDAPDGDILSLGNVTYNNASRVVELHGGTCPPSMNVINSGNTIDASWSLGGYTTPASYYCTGVDCSAANQWYGIMFDTRSLLQDFLIFAESDGTWSIQTNGGAIPGITPAPGRTGTDLFPTDFDFAEVWLPGAPAGNRHRASEY
jgi:hypothetical protein